MSKIGFGYGSEWHLLRFLGRHRNYLNEKIIDVIKMDETDLKERIHTNIDRVDFDFDKKKKVHCDVELKGINFLNDDHLRGLLGWGERNDFSGKIVKDWARFWPQTGNQQNWDAIGTVQIDSNPEILLVEAKAHLAEIESKCGAKEDGGLPIIKASINETIKYYQKKSLVSDENSCQHWLKPYYQFANRLCTLYFLTKNNLKARMIYIYFIGDNDDLYDNGAGLSDSFCPKSKDEWCNVKTEKGKSGINKMYDYLGFQPDEEGEYKIERVHKVFINVRGEDNKIE